MQIINLLLGNSSTTGFPTTLCAVKPDANPSYTSRSLIDSMLSALLSPSNQSNSSTLYTPLSYDLNTIYKTDVKRMFLEGRVEWVHSHY